MFDHKNLILELENHRTQQRKCSSLDDNHSILLEAVILAAVISGVFSLNPEKSLWSRSSDLLYEPRPDETFVDWNSISTIDIMKLSIAVRIVLRVCFSLAANTVTTFFNRRFNTVFFFFIKQHCSLIIDTVLKSSPKDYEVSAWRSGCKPWPRLFFYVLYSPWDRTKGFRVHMPWFRGTVSFL